MKRYFLPFLLCFVFHTAYSQIPFWHQTAGPKAGTITDISVDSSGRAIVWSEGSGVYRSTDEGNTWKLLNKGLPRINMSRGVSGRDGYLFGINTQYQVFRFDQNATDGSWENITPTFSLTINVYDIAADPNGHVYLATSRYGVLRSDDNGSTWLIKKQNLYDTLSKTKIDSGIYFLGLASDGTLFASMQYGSVWRSTDHGDNWQKFPKRDPDSSASGSFQSTMAIAPNGNVVIGNYGNFTKITGGTIYVTDDNGSSWKKVYQREWNSGDRKNHVDKLLRVPGENVLYANAHGPTLRSLDNGLTWDVMDSQKRGDEPFSMASLGSSLFQVCEPDGVFLSGDNGKNWEEKNTGLLAQYMRGIAINSHQDIFAITEYGLHISSDNGDSWDIAPEYGENYFPNIFINSKDYIYIGTERGLYRSKDNGKTLSHIDINLDTTTNNRIIQVGESPWGALYSATQIESIGFIYSTNDGDSWQIVPNMPPSSAPEAFTFATRDTLLSSRGSQYYLSTNQGVNWDIIASDNPNGSKELLIYRDGSYLSLADGEGGGIKRSTDGAHTWQQIFPPTGDFPAFKNYFSMTVDVKGDIVVCTDSGIYQSVDKNFTEWRSVSRGLSAQDFPNHFVNVSAVVQNSIDHRFYAATRGLSVFQSIPDFDTSKVGVREVSASALVQMSANPNPFSEHVTLGFHTSEYSDVKLELFDALGRHERSIFHSFLDPGEHSVTIDGAGLPSGEHIVALYCGGMLQTLTVRLVR
jgi:photosystem II stability/assembly factor-like uncharacterized protein